MISLFKTLGDQNRMRIVNLLMESRLCVCELELILNITQSNVSRHLSRLRGEKIIAYEKQAQWIYYTLDPDFAARHRQLVEYLKARMEKDAVFQEDRSRLQAYEGSGESCETLKGRENALFAGGEANDRRITQVQNNNGGVQS